MRFIRDSVALLQCDEGSCRAQLPEASIDGSGWAFVSVASWTRHYCGKHRPTVRAFEARAAS